MAMFGMPMRTVIVIVIALIALAFMLIFILNQSGLIEKFAGVITGTTKTI